jgi:hypothetical protein
MQSTGRKALEHPGATESAASNELNLYDCNLSLTRFVIYDLPPYPGDLPDSQFRKLSGRRLS